MRIADDVREYGFERPSKPRLLHPGSVDNAVDTPLETGP
jgi:hypothetical protein